MGRFVTNLSSIFLLPPLNLVLLGLVGVLLLRHHTRPGQLLVASAMILLYLLSTPFVTGSMLRKLEAPFVSGFSNSNNGAQAIVVLGGGTISMQWSMAMIR